MMMMMTGSSGVRCRWRVWRRSWTRWRRTTRIFCVPSSTSSRRWSRRTRRRGAPRRPSRLVHSSRSVAKLIIRRRRRRPVCWRRSSTRRERCATNARPLNEKTPDYASVPRPKVVAYCVLQNCVVCYSLRWTISSPLKQRNRAEVQSVKFVKTETHMPGFWNER